MSKPKIRFKGYEEDWEQRKLGDLVDVLDGDRGKNYPTSDDFDISGHTIFLNASNVTNNGFLFQDNQFITEEKSNNMGNGKLEEDDIVITSRGSLGHIAWYNADISSLMPYARINSGMLILRNKKEIETEYLYHFMKSDKGQSQISFISFGSAQPQLTKKGVEDLKVILPTRRDEQTQLGHCFSSLDHLITLHQRKCEETKKLKKYMLQKMFPQNGKRVPEIRFAGFTDDWEQRKLPEFVTFFNGLTYTPDDVEETGTLVLRSSNVKNGEIVDADNVYVNDKVVTSENVQEGDIIVVVRNGSRALIGKHAQIKAPMPNTVIGAFMTGIRSEHSSFVNALLDTSAFENEIAKNMGATINQITGYMFSKMEFMIPSGEEQQKIGEYFQSFDDLITLHQRKYEELQKIKKFMLQNMFI